ncbi:MAG: hypothetical protein JOZ62_20135 [Acidobacteriaceae bacterium]|nr:hypothetical protein [Acidobacteriaceae bacterium]
MKIIFSLVLLSVLCKRNVCDAQVPEVRPQVAGRAIQESQVTTIYLAPRFATAVRMPDAINSVVVGDPDSFSAEHSDKEPRLVFVKPITTRPAQTNLLISTTRGYQANLLLISRGEISATQPAIDFLMSYRPAGHFMIEPGEPSIGVAQITALVAPDEKSASAGQHDDRSSTTSTARLVPSSFASSERSAPANIASANGEITGGRDETSELDALLQRQKRAPLPAMYGEKPGIASPGRQLLKAGVSEVIDQGRQVAVLFSVLNVQDHAVELMPPQIQLAGKVEKGAIVRHKVWSNSEQLPVEEFRVSRRRLGPGERADGVVVFERPSFKQSNETVLLQIGDSGAVDRPALAPIGFGISSVRKGDE